MSHQNKYLTLMPLFLVLVIDTMGAGIIFPILGPLFMTPHESILPLAATAAERQFWYGATLSAWAILMFVGAPFLGDLSDRLGRKRVLMLALTGTATGFAVSAVGIDWGNVWLLMVGRLIAGFFAGSQPIAQAVIADISSEKNKVHNMSLIIVANCLGFIFGPIVGGYFADPDIVSWFSYSTPFYAAGVLAIINALLLLVTLRESYEPKRDVKLNLARGLIVFASAFTDKSIRWFSLVLYFAQYGWSLFFLFVPIYLVQTYQYDNLDIAHYMSYMGLMFMFGLTVVIRILVKYLRLETLVVVMMAIMGVSLIAFDMASEYWQWVLSIPIAMCSGIGYSVMITICSNAVSKDKQGWIMGITSSIVAAAFGLASIASGTLATMTISMATYIGVSAEVASQSSFAVPFVLAGLATLLSGLMLYLVDAKQCRSR